MTTKVEIKDTSVDCEGDVNEESGDEYDASAASDTEDQVFDDAGKIVKGKLIECDEKGLRICLSKIQYKTPKGAKRVPWIDTLAITSNKPTLNESTERGTLLEQKIYDQTLDGVRHALERLCFMGIPFTRPSDYMAEMAKDDHMMKRVRTVVQIQEDKMEAVAKRRRYQDQLKLQKKVKHAGEKVKQMRIMNRRKIPHNHKNKKK